MKVGAPVRSRRGLMLRDGLGFFVLTISAMALFGMTFFLFRSFAKHRAALAVEWTERGRVALRGGRPELAVSALRTALGYVPDEREDQLLLAQALADAGHMEEATNYFLVLWEERPGDGLINLQLARLASRRGETARAIEYYRAAVFGSWAEGIERRQGVRLELADYLIGAHQFLEARDELLTLAGNDPRNVSLNLAVIGRMQAAGYPEDALRLDERVLGVDSRNRVALEGAGRIAYALGEYATAARLLKKAAREGQVSEDVAALAKDAAGRKER